MVATNSKKINLVHTEIILRADNIVQVNASDHGYSETDIKEVNSAIGELTNRTRTLVLIVASNYSDIDSAARKFLSKPEAAIYSMAEAYVIKSLAQRIIANFFIKVSGTPVRTKFFTETEPAIIWLKSLDFNL